MSLIHSRFAALLLLELVLLCAGVLSYALVIGPGAIWPLSGLAVLATAWWAVASVFLLAKLWIAIAPVMLKDAGASALWLGKVAILGLGPLAAGFAWPHVVERLKTVDVTAAVVQDGGRRDVLLNGYVNDPSIPAFGNQKLTIEEPGKAPYDRLVGLTTGRRFELTLGEPVLGKYSVSVHWQPNRWLAPGGKEQLKLPDLHVGGLPGNSLPRVRATAHDYERLFALPAVASVLAVLVGLFARRSLQAPSP